MVRLPNTRLMSKRKYQEARPSISADIHRAVEVESGHACAVTRCSEHTYLEIHHINKNREDNRVENLILLCDKHHKMAHSGVIDRKALSKYKELLVQSYNKTLSERVERLEALLAQMPKFEARSEQAPTVVADRDLPTKQVTPRPALMALTLEQLALAKYEKEHQLFFERQPHFTKGGARLQLDAIRQDDELPEDIVIEVRWLRKRYLEGPVWIQQIDAAVSLYELITGRKAKGVLILVVPNPSLKELVHLPLTAAALEASERKPNVVIYSYEDLGYDPGPISAGVFASNVETTDDEA